MIADLRCQCRLTMSDAADRSAERVQRLRESVIAAVRSGGTGIDVMAEICDVCVQLLPVDGAAVSLFGRDGGRETLHSSDPVIARLESVQSTLGEGPGVEAFTARRPVLVPDLAHAPSNAWPVFGAETAALPVAAFYAFPLQIGAIAIGALDLYRQRPGWFSKAELASALRLGDVATLALMGTRVDATAADAEDDWLAKLPHGGSAVHQATGMLIAQYRIPADQALARLRGYAFGAGRLVEDVSLDLVARRLSPADIEI